MNAIEKIRGYKEEYMAFGITKDGSDVSYISVPWEKTVSAFNMKLPDVYITPEDIKDPQVIEELLKHKIVGVYIFTALEDYSFLKQFKNIWDLSIYDGKNLKDISFVRELTECKMIYIREAHLSDLEDIFAVKRQFPVGLFRPFTHISLDDCIIDSYGSLFDSDIRFTEFIVFQRKGSPEKSKLKKVAAHTYRYYEFEVKGEE